MQTPLTLKVTLFFIASCLASCLASCVSQSQFSALVETTKAQRRDIAELTNQNVILAARIENESRRLWSQTLCKSGKVASFLDEIQAGIPEVCTAGSLANALLFMNTQPYAIANLRSRDGLKSLHISRRGQIRDLLDPYRIHPSTRLLVLLQPDEETPAGQQRALEIGAEIKALLQEELPRPRELRPTDSLLLPREVRILGPYLLPCKLRSEQRSRYNSGPMDRPVPGEPPENKPTVRIWIFRTDC